MKNIADLFPSEVWEKVDRERGIGEMEREIETLLVRLESAINPDLRVELVKHVKVALDLLEKEVGSRGVGDYYQRLNRAFGDVIEEVAVPEGDEEELPKEMIVEGKKRIMIIIALENMFDRLETEQDIETRRSLAKRIEDFLDKNESIIVREDKSGATEVEYYRERLNKLREKRKGVAA
jgi:hypothetical protein